MSGSEKLGSSKFGSSKFGLGLVVGLAIGAAAMYGVIELRGSETGDDVLLASVDLGELSRIAEAPTEKKLRRGKKRGKKQRNRKSQPIDGPVEVSAADRKMTWRGPSVTLPDRDADFAQGGGGRSLSGGEINAGLAKARPALASCIAKARGNADLSAKMTLKFLVDAGGRVGRVRARAPVYLQKRKLLSCAAGAVRRVRFAASGAPTVVTLPFEVE